MKTHSMVISEIQRLVSQPIGAIPVTTDFPAVGEDFHKPEDLIKNLGKHYLHGHDEIGDDVLPKVASSDSFCEGGDATPSTY